MTPLLVDQRLLQISQRHRWLARLPMWAHGTGDLAWKAAGSEYFARTPNMFTDPVSDCGSHDIDKAME